VCQTHQRSCPRLGEALERAQRQGWKNVTDHELTLKHSFDSVTEFIPDGPRSTATPKRTFLRLFSEDLLNHIAEHTRTTLQQRRKGATGPKCKVNNTDILNLFTDNCRWMCWRDIKFEGILSKDW
jgi:hypothetical protein